MSGMDVTFNMRGMAELVQKLHAIGDKVAQREAAEQDLMAAAAPIVDAARAGAPRDPGGRPGFGADTIHVEPEETRTEAEIARVAVGPGPNGWHLRFSEEGTSKEAARPWLRPAVDTNEGAFLSVLADRLAARIRGAV